MADQKQRSLSIKDKNIQMTDLKVAFVYDENISKAEKQYYALL